MALPTCYNDCMIEARKDDKTPPVVVALKMWTVYCDGVLLVGADEVLCRRHQTATVERAWRLLYHDVCEEKMHYHLAQIPPT